MKIKKIDSKLALVILALSVFFAQCDKILEPPPKEYQVRVGCYSSSYNGAAYSQIGCGVLSSFGDYNLDQAFQQEISYQNQFWGNVPASVYPFDECQGIQNAVSLPSGYIMFGVNLTWNVINYTGDTIGLAGIMAHEWAHQVQFQFGYMGNNSSTVKPTELEADAFSGFYMGLSYNWAWSRINGYFQVLASLGDYNFNNRNHHGTPTERLNAGYLGWITAMQAISSNYQYSYGELHYLFTNQIYQHVAETENQDNELISYIEPSKKFLKQYQVIEILLLNKIKDNKVQNYKTNNISYKQRTTLFPKL